MSRHIQTRKFMYQATPNPKLCLMKSSMKRSTWFFLFQTWKFQKPSQDRASFWSDYEGYMLNFSYSCFKLFKSWSNLGFDQDSNGHKNSKKKNIMKNQCT